MEYSWLCHTGSYSVPLHPVRNKLLVLCVMLSLWVYMLYCCVGYCSTVPGFFMLEQFPKPDAEPDSRAEDWGDESSRGDDATGAFNNNNNNGTESKKLPQAIIIGVKKGGTRALLEFLRVHPDVRAVGAEPHFFDRNYHRGLEWYRELMPKTAEGQITMEKTPSYFVTEEVPSRIYAMSPDTKLIVVVRDPVTRAISDYTQTRSKKPDIASFESLAFRNATSSSSSSSSSATPPSARGAVDASWSALQIGIYARHLERWLRFFPLGQMLFVSGERLISDPAGEMTRVQDFLGIGRVLNQDHFHFDLAKGFPCLKKPQSNAKPRCLGKTKGRTHPNVRPDVVRRLREFYKPYNERFYRMSGQDFGWN